ncbi:cellulose biosynthesis protein BcsD [Shimwellia blattae]|uniref:Cellulose synthase n=1 Tax=Shimwellia blattae (strain ATCC 29907 / DSM 4481 / JCM 1650 / NBRC 105725 / CDC 9005-74) TaxID=630626 RepID=I2B537_SHIBC|nr:cellulose biosynthesis protein BcsD [Shimwellia blattae]AFJ45641.1 hypothetical protein EBL_c05150 [Shimwellia blattae DSM 4481 = NBRC 105725]VDY63124.1 Cellulose synthase operon protein D [Shimwellia blattae]VEC20350.1 Cellulose synthase operon protein D [Shimwellia blattae]
MTTDALHGTLLRYYQQQQTPEGWFDLLTIMVDGMIGNVGEQECQPFLQDMGCQLAARYPLPACETVGDLEDAINRLLAHFNWGTIEIDLAGQAMLLRHRGLPVARAQQDSHEQHRWCNAFSVILEGMYGAWLATLRAAPHLRLHRDHIYGVSDIQFRYQG